MKSLGLCLTLIFFSYATSWSCSCVYINSFCETITYGSGTIDSNYLIVHGRVEDKSNQRMKVRVIDVLFGTPGGYVITIPQGYGVDCRESIDRFDVNSEYIFALFGQSEGGYNLSICGVTSLSVSGNQIIGDIAPGVHKIAITDFPDIQNCGGIGSVLSSIDVTPTLSSEIIQVSTTRDIESIHITMYDMLGRLVYSVTPEVLLEAQPWVIDSSHFPTGYYVIATETAGIRRVFRVVIVS